MRSFNLVFALLLACVLSIAAFGQTTIAPPVSAAAALPSNLGGFGLGFQSMSSPKASGWGDICHRNPDVLLFDWKLPSYSCLATDYTTGATSGRADIDTVVVHTKYLLAGSKTGAGAALGANGVGGSFVAGGWFGVDISKWLKLNQLYLAGSATWQKDDIVAAAGSAAPGVALRTLGTRATWRFGFIHGWN
jgi:hypothetical protein